MTRTAALAAALAMTLAPALAAAQQQGMLPIKITGDSPAIRYEVTRDHGTESYTCQAPCTLWVPAGRYRVSASGEGIPSKRQRLDVYGPAAVDVQAGSSSGRTGGLVLGIAGSGAVLIGLGGLFAQCAGECRMENVNRTPWLVLGGVGVVGALIGWPLFVANGTSMTVQESRPVSKVESLRVAVLPTPGGGLSFAATGTF
ncbi:MAG: hypothetical protein IPJ34_15820 [Myxococcales bacterium]|nr:hypothetical protein [Myxococcales bacterium]